jgi:drug/metabolite transporter (DMT)-like permease
MQLVWSLTPSASNVVIRYLPVETYIALRFSLSGAIFLAWTLVRHGLPRITREDWPRLIALGVGNYGLASLGTLYGLKIGGVFNFGLASSVNAVITATTAIIVLRETVGRGFFLAVPLSIAGSLLLFAGKNSLAGAQVAAGSLLCVTGAYLCEALGLVHSRRYRAKYSLAGYLAVLQLSGAAALWIVVAASGRGGASALLHMPPVAWVSFLFVAIVACVLCFGIHYWLLGHLDGHRLAFFDCFHSMGAAFWGVVLFEEPFNATMLWGGALLAASVLATNLRSRRESVSPTSATARTSLSTS